MSHIGKSDFSKPFLELRRDILKSYLFSSITGVIKKKFNIFNVHVDMLLFSSDN